MCQEHADPLTHFRSRLNAVFKVSVHEIRNVQLTVLSRYIEELGDCPDSCVSGQRDPDTEHANKKHASEIRNAQVVTADFFGLIQNSRTSAIRDPVQIDSNSVKIMRNASAVRAPTQASVIGLA